MTAADASTRVVSIQETGWARLLFALLSQRFTGRAEFTQDGARRLLVFRGGFAVWTDHEVPNTGLTEILSAAGVLAPAEVERVLADAQDDSLDAYRVMLELRLVDDETAMLAMRDQCEQRLIATAGLRGEFTLHDAPGLPEDILERLEPSRTLQVINLGVRSYTSPSVAEQSLAHLDNAKLQIGRAYAKYGERFGFDDGELGTLRLLGSRTSFQLGDLLHISGLDAVRGIQLLYTLWSCNMLVEAGSEPELPEEEVGRGHSESSLVQDLIIAKIDAGAPPYEILALSMDATLPDIEAAVAELQRKVAGVVPAESIAEILRAAQVQRKMAARSIAKKALTDRKWARAAAALRDTVALQPDDPPSTLDLAWAVWNEHDRVGDGEARTLDEAVAACGAEDPVVRARAQFYRGHLRKHQGRRDEALSAFKEAIELDERLLDAQREMRALGGVSGKQPKAKKAKKGQPIPAGNPKMGGRPRHKYWSGPWPFIWIASGLLIAGLVAAQVILRLNMEIGIK